MTTTTKYKRRTFKDVEAAGYDKGFEEGLKRGIEHLDEVTHANLELGRRVMSLETQLANVSLRQLAWSRIKGLFRGRDDRLA
jgi:hypothetical protein